MTARPTIDPRSVAVGGNVTTRTLTSGKQRWLFKWTAAGPRTNSFASSYEAEQFRSGLLKAKTFNQPFDLETGWPVHMLPAEATAPAPVTTALEVAQKVIANDWDVWSPGNRKSRVESMAPVIAHLTDSEVPDDKSRPGRTAVLRALQDLLLPPEGARTPSAGPDVVAAAAWLEKHSLPMDQVTLTVVEAALLAAAKKADGSYYARDRRGHQRTSCALLCAQAMREGHLTTNLAHAARRINTKATIGKSAATVSKVKAWETEADTSVVVDPKRVATPAQCKVLVEGVREYSTTSWRYVAFLTLLWMTGMRPSEAAGVRLDDRLVLPTDGSWGLVRLWKPVVATGARWTGNGEAHAERPSLKAREEGEERPVQLHPDLVACLLEHIETAGVGPGELLFTNSNGHPIDPSAMGKVWRPVRNKLHPTGGLRFLTVYNLRHCQATLLLKRVGAVRAAEELGNSAPVLLRTYYRCLETDDSEYQAKMADAYDD